MGRLPTGLHDVCHSFDGGDQLSFFARKPWRLSIAVKADASAEYIKESNLDPERMTKLALVRAGYGSLAEIEAMDTTEYLDIVEFEQMRGMIEKYHQQQAQPGGK